MEDVEESSSDTSSTVLDLANKDLNDARENTNEGKEITEDLTTEDACTINGESTSIPSSPIEGLPVIKSRPYQLEMLEESLKRNIIVAVSISDIST